MPTLGTRFFRALPLAALWMMASSARAPLDAQIYVANANADSVLVFDDTLTGDQPPLQEITATPSAMDLVSSVAVDRGRNEILVGVRSFDQVWTFPIGADGPTAVARVLAGAATTINTAWDLEIDHERGELYVLSKDNSEILVFPIDAAGNTAPSRTLETLPNWPTSTLDFDLDLVHDEIVVTDRTPGAAGLIFFARDADGFVSVTRSITGAATGLTDPIGVAVDPLHNEVYVVQGFSLRVFARNVGGNAAPLRILTGAATGIGAARAIDVDPIAGEISVLRTLPDEAVLIFPRTATGDTAPARILAGAATHLNGPSLHSYFPWLVLADGFELGNFFGWSLSVP